MRLAPLAIAPYATSPCFASRAKVADADEYDSLTDVQAVKVAPVHKVIDNDHLESRSLNNQRREH
jgi:hypothetical protein